MKFIIIILAILMINIPAWAEEPIAWEQNGRIVVAMKHFDVGIKEGFVLPKTGQDTGAAVETYHVLTEASDVLTDESGNQLRTE